MRKLAFVLTFSLAAALACRKAETPEPATRGKDAPATAKSAKTATPPAASSEPGTEVGNVMPEYEALELDGGRFELAAHRDKVVLLNLWATWCGPCRAEIPELQAMHDKYASRGFAVIGVSVDETGAEAVKEFVEEQKMTYPIVLDAEGKLANIFQTSVLPTSVIVDRNGRIVWKRFGIITPGDAEVLEAIEKAL